MTRRAITTLLTTLVAALAAAVVPASAGAEILLDQVDPTSPQSFSSQDFAAEFDEFDSEATDDFTVPAGQTWSLEDVLARGRNTGDGVPSGARVTIYNDGGTQPGTVRSVQTAPVAAYPRMELALPSPVTLPAGSYWLSVVAILGTNGESGPDQWFWAGSDAGPFGDSALFRNPGGGFDSGCEEFTPPNDCNIVGVPGGPADDMSFNLAGTRTVLPTGPSQACLEAEAALNGAESKLAKAKRKARKADGKKAKKRAKAKVKRAKKKVRNAKAAVEAAC